MNKLNIEIFDCETGEKIYNSWTTVEIFHPTNKQNLIKVPDVISASVQSFLRGVVCKNRSVSLSISAFPLPDVSNVPLFSSCQEDVY